MKKQIIIPLTITLCLVLISSLIPVKAAICCMFKDETCDTAYCDSGSSCPSGFLVCDCSTWCCPDPDCGCCPTTTTSTTTTTAPPACSCTAWADVSCATGGCSLYTMEQKRTCTPSGCASEKQCILKMPCSCGNGICDAGIESFSNCPGDCTCANQGGVCRMGGQACNNYCSLNGYAFCSGGCTEEFDCGAGSCCCKCIECESDADCSCYTCDSAGYPHRYAKCDPGTGKCTRCDPCDYGSDCEGSYCCSREIDVSRVGSCVAHGIYQYDSKYLCDPPGWVSSSQSGSQNQNFNFFDWLFSFFNL